MLTSEQTRLISLALGIECLLETQSEYFKKRQTSTLIRSKNIEKRLEARAKEVLDGLLRQGIINKEFLEEMKQKAFKVLGD